MDQELRPLPNTAANGSEGMSSPPLIYFFLLLPAGIGTGFLTVTLPFVLAKQGWSVAAIAALVAIGNSTHLWRFLWSPIVDLTLSVRTWYLIGLIPAVAAMGVLGVVPPQEGWLFTGLVLFSQVAGTIVILPVPGMIAHSVRENAQGRASGWYQAGSLGGCGIGGGLGVWLATHSTYAMACWVFALTMLFCALALRWVPNVRPLPGDRISVRLKELGRDFWTLIRSRKTLYVVILMSSPIGIGAASWLWSAVASEWQVSDDTVALVTGTLAGIASAVGCVIGGWVCDRMGRFWAFFGSGTLLAILAVIMAATPHTPMAYCFIVLLYALLMGVCYGAFTAIVLFAVGKGAASGKYAIIASLGNLPCVYMAAFDGWAHDRWGASGMLYFEAIVVVPVIILGLIGLRLIRSNTTER